MSEKHKTAPECLHLIIWNFQTLPLFLLDTFSIQWATTLIIPNNVLQSIERSFSTNDAHFLTAQAERCFLMMALE